MFFGRFVFDGLTTIRVSRRVLVQRRLSPLCGVGAVVSVVTGNAVAVFMIAHWVRRFGTMAFGQISLVLLDPLVAIGYHDDLIPFLLLVVLPVSVWGRDGFCQWLCSCYLSVWCAFAFELLLFLSGVRGRYRVCTGRRTRCHHGLVHPKPACVG